MTETIPPASKHGASGRAFTYLNHAVELAIAALMFLMVAVGGLQVFCRYMLNASLSWSEELQRFSHIWLVFLAIPLGYDRGSHIGMTLLLGNVPPRGRAIIALLGDVLWLVLACAMVFYTARILEVAKHQTSSGLGLPMDWVYCVIVVSGVYLAILAVKNIVERLREFRPSPEKEEEPC